MGSLYLPIFCWHYSILTAYNLKAAGCGTGISSISVSVCKSFYGKIKLYALDQICYLGSAFSGQLFSLSRFAELGKPGFLSTPINGYRAVRQGFLVRRQGTLGTGRQAARYSTDMPIPPHTRNFLSVPSYVLPILRTASKWRSG